MLFEVLKQCPRPPNLPDAEGKLLPPSRQQQLADEAVLADAKKDKTQLAKREAVAKVFFRGNPEEEAQQPSFLLFARRHARCTSEGLKLRCSPRLCRVLENCQERFLKCEKEFVDLGPTLKFARGLLCLQVMHLMTSHEVMQHARQLFPQAHVAHWGAVGSLSKENRWDQG